ncbi:MAG TPA: winged helix-turn-helix domain-containing protein [Bradyrhizobium sp.]|nr:winged helix-turn-helix domain-containing protein [Bradyrhizobium sp.]
MSGGFVRRLTFGPFELLSDHKALQRDGVVLPLSGRALDLLIYLASRPGKVIPKQELIDHVWSDVTVEEGSLRVHISAIRKTLGDGQFGNRYVANIQGRGYSFVGSVAGFEADVRSSNDQDHYRRQLLPARPPKVIGRERLLREVEEKLREHRFVTLHGACGIGKTTVAVAVGHVLVDEFRGRVHFVDLASLTGPNQVAPAIGQSLGLALESNEAALELVGLAHSRKLLLILDNCEHVVEAAALIAEQLYQETAQVHLLTTSRELLKVEGERCYRIPALDFPPDHVSHTADALLRFPAVRFFVERAMADGAVFDDGEMQLVAEMCQKMDGVPLAIERVAGQVAALDLQNAGGLSRSEVLELGQRTANPRHRTLKAALDWSYDLLSDVERIVFRRVAAFPDQFSLEDARYIAGELAGGRDEIFDAIAGLAEKSLIETRLVEGYPEYRLLGTTRAYALAKLDHYAEFDAIRRRHAEYVAARPGPQPPVWAPAWAERITATSC